MDVVHAWRLPALERTPTKCPIPGDVYLGNGNYQGDPPLDIRARLPTKETKRNNVLINHLTIHFTWVADQVACLKKKITGPRTCATPSRCGGW